MKMVTAGFVFRNHFIRRTKNTRPRQLVIILSSPCIRELLMQGMFGDKTI